MANITEHGLLGVSEAIDAGGNAPDTHYDPWVSVSVFLISL